MTSESKLKLPGERLEIKACGEMCCSVEAAWMVRIKSVSTGYWALGRMSGMVPATVKVILPIFAMASNSTPTATNYKTFRISVHSSFRDMK